VSAPDNSSNVLQRVNGKWEIRFDGVMASCSDSVAMSYFRHLIERQRKEVHVTDLVTKTNGEPIEIMDAKELIESGVAVVDDGVDEISGEEGQQVVTTEFADEILSDEDRAYVLVGLEKERGNLAKLESKGLPREVLLKKEEIQTIEKYLKDHRFGSKNVCFENRASRDRTSVRNAIARGIEKIGKIHAALARHLRESIRTGTYCSYVPATNIVWTL